VEAFRPRGLVVLTLFSYRLMPASGPSSDVSYRVGAATRLGWGSRGD
jgi:hypothetical protein